MVSESGPHLKPAVSARLLALVAALASVSGCVYFNSLYNTNRAFDRGVAELEEGNPGTGRASLTEAIEKAEKIVANNPNSKWADDAQKMVAEARVLLEDWPEAAEASRELLGMVSSASDSALAAGFLGMAEARLGDYPLADSLLTAALPTVRGKRRLAGLYYSRGLARIGTGDLSGAEADYREASSRRPDWINPRLERARLLIVDGRTQEAAFELAQIFKTDPGQDDEELLFQTTNFLAAVDAEAARISLVGVEETRMSTRGRGRFVKLRADMHRTVGREDLARADYELTMEIASGTRYAVDAAMELAYMELGRAESMDELEAVLGFLREARTLPWGSRIGELGLLIDAIRRLEFYVERGNVGYIAAAEVALSELRSPRLARAFYLDYVEENAEGLWAPKAILAALDLSESGQLGSNGGGGDEVDVGTLRDRLYAEYRTSAYVQAVLGEGSAEGFSYEQLEDGLKRQLERLQIQADRVLADPRRSANR